MKSGILNETEQCKYISADLIHINLQWQRQLTFRSELFPVDFFCVYSGYGLTLCFDCDLEDCQKAFRNRLSFSVFFKALGEPLKKAEVSMKRKKMLRCFNGERNRFRMLTVRHCSEVCGYVTSLSSAHTHSHMLI